jgi:hypothetical protein
VPQLANLDVYCEAGEALTLEHEGALSGLSDEAYRRLYVEKLKARHETYPLVTDQRFWQVS